MIFIDSVHWGKWQFRHIYCIVCRENCLFLPNPLTDPPMHILFLNQPKLYVHFRMHCLGEIRYVLLILSTLLAQDSRYSTYLMQKILLNFNWFT